MDLQSAAVQERLRRIEAPACFGGFAIRRQLPIPVSADLQSAAVQERLRRIEAPACFGGFAIRRRTGTPTED